MYFIKKVSLFLCMQLLFSCAGPTSPFGAIEFGDLKFTSNTLNLQVSTNTASIDIVPQAKIYHRSHDIELKVRDEKGIPPGAFVKVIYNGKDYTTTFMRHAQVEKSHDNKSLKIIHQGIKTPAHLDHDFKFQYHRQPASVAAKQQLKTPHCPIRYKEIDVQALSNPLIETLHLISIRENINPYLLIGLVAQESAFNPNAVSWAKALGLTQITSLAEDHIVEKYNEWPRYSNVGRMSMWKIKSLISLGKITAKNEWRLDAEKSMIGGAYFIDYIDKYWQRSKHQELLAKHSYIIYEDVLLASYNSGSYRVKKAIQSRGTNWLNDRSLREAKKYVKKVKSYCQSFQDFYDQEVKHFKRLSKYEKKGHL